MFSVHLIVIDIIALLTSFLGNTFILATNAQEWLESKSISISDVLICGISFFSSLYEVLKLCGYILQLPLIHLVFTYDVQRVSTVVCLAIMSCNIWISTWLSVNFCLKIVSIQHRFYIHLQRRFPKMITWLLLPSVLISFLLSLTFLWDLSGIHWSNVAFNPSLKNTSALAMAPRCVCWYEAFIAFSSLGFLLSIASLVTIIGSIYRHMKHMQQSQENVPNLSVHIRATQTIALLIIIDTFFCYALTLTALKGNDSGWTRYIYIFTSFCYALNSFNIILGNGKLKRKFISGFVPCSCTGNRT